MCAMMLSEMGADVVRIDRTQDAGLGIDLPERFNFLNRGRRSIAIDLKNEAGIEAILKMVERADALVEGFRPGVMERLGLGPDVCMKRNPGLVFGRITGWGQEGPLAKAAGHDINYIALSGALHAIGRSDDDPPPPPLNLVGDFGGGALYIVVGILAALLEVKRSGKGQVVDAGMVDGALSLMTAIYGMKAEGMFIDKRRANILDGGAHFYNSYKTKDGKYVSIGSIEAKFYAELLEKLDIDPGTVPPQMEREQWPAMTDKFEQIFLTKTRDEWCAIMENTDICFAPVLTLEEAPDYPHNKQRNAFVECAGVLQPAPAPRFSRTPSSIKGRAPAPGEHTEEALVDWGLSDGEIARLKDAKAIV